MCVVRTRHRILRHSGRTSASSDATCSPVTSDVYSRGSASWWARPPQSRPATTTWSSRCWRASGQARTQGSLLRQLPSIAGLLVIFLAGILGHRWGERRFITRCGILFTVGNAVVAVAPVMAVAVAGLVLESIGASGFIVVALALLSSRVSDKEARASAFSTYAMVGPIVYLAMPLLAGVLLDHSSWRLVAAVWALSGLVILMASRKYLPTAEGPRDSRELLTPALAGVLLMAAVQTLSAATPGRAALGRRARPVGHRGPRVRRPGLGAPAHRIPIAVVGGTGTGRNVPPADHRHSHVVREPVVLHDRRTPVRVRPQRLRRPRSRCCPLRRRQSSER